MDTNETKEKVEEGVSFIQKIWGYVPSFLKNKLISMVIIAALSAGGLYEYNPEGAESMYNVVVEYVVEIIK